LQLTPAPKWKLVVDIGDEDVTAVSCSATTTLIEQTIDSTMCNTDCSFDDASLLSDGLAMIDTMESSPSADE
jgi:hypothetical protein